MNDELHQSDDIGALLGCVLVAIGIACALAGTWSLASDDLIGAWPLSIGVVLVLVGVVL